MLPIHCSFDYFLIRLLSDPSIALSSHFDCYLSLLRSLRLYHPSLILLFPDPSLAPDPSILPLVSNPLLTYIQHSIDCSLIDRLHIHRSFHCFISHAPSMLTSIEPFMLPDPLLLRLLSYPSLLRLLSYPSIVPSIATPSLVSSNDEIRL